MISVIILTLLVIRANTQLLVEDASEGPCLSVSELLPHLHRGLDLVPVVLKIKFVKHSSLTYQSYIVFF